MNQNIIYFRTFIQRVLLVFLLLVVFLQFSPTSKASSMEVTITSSTPRRANIPYYEDTVDWAQSAILWFGINELDLPGKNYVDVRLVYTAQALEIRFTIIDYYLWYNTNPQSSDDLSQYDAAAVYLDVNHDRASQPQSDDYYLLSGARHFPNDNAPQYHRDARGTGAGWDTSWTGAWLDFSAMQWSNNGPNDNGGNIDYGWFTYYTIPWSVLGLSGPPSEGTVWGLGLRLYDRDDNPPAGGVPPQHWPESFQTANPATWGEIHFGDANYTPETSIPTGSTEIRAASSTDNTVEDAWMGGGGTCAGGHSGGSEINHGDNGALFTGSESSPTHFPCFNKSFLRFQIDKVPSNMEIISATLTLHLWGNADQSIAPPFSYVHLFTISDDWDEMTIHWNNAPLAQENISAISVYPYSQPDVVWPGDPYTWDASQAVAEAYAEGNPVNLALYASDVGRDTSKYFVSSETGDWNIAGRPMLKVIWGLSNPEINKTGTPSIATRDDRLTFTLTWTGNGQNLSLVDQLPVGLGTPTNLQANIGNTSYDSPSNQIRWNGNPAIGQTVILTYQVPVEVDGPISLTNSVTLSGNSGPISSDSFSVLIDPVKVFLPLLHK
jgi:hypothetical protein